MVAHYLLRPNVTLENRTRSLSALRKKAWEYPEIRFNPGLRPLLKFFSKRLPRIAGPGPLKVLAWLGWEMPLNYLDLQLRAHVVGCRYQHTAAEYEIEKCPGSIL